MIRNIFLPGQLGEEALPPEALKMDKKSCTKIGPCGIGSKALYLNSFFLDRVFYLPVSSVKRVFKRVAMSKGGFTGKGLFASIPYLVVEYDDGKEKQFIFKYEENLDQFLELFHSRWPEIPVHSKMALQRLEEKERLKAEKRSAALSSEALSEIGTIRKARQYLEERPDLFAELSRSAKARRVNERSSPAYKWAAFFIVIMGLFSAAFGIVSVLSHRGNAVYFLLFGLAAVFLFSAGNVLPTRNNNRRYIEEELRRAVENMEGYIGNYPDFPLPARYAHPLALEWMEEIMEEGRAPDAAAALEELKKDLKALNSSVTVDEEEYERIMAIKPLFLIWDYA